MQVVVPPLTDIKRHMSKMDRATYSNDENHFDLVVNMTDLKRIENLYFDMNKIFIRASRNMRKVVTYGFNLDMLTISY